MVLSVELAGAPIYIWLLVDYVRVSCILSDAFESAVLWHSITLMWKMFDLWVLRKETQEKSHSHRITDHWHISALWYLSDMIMRLQHCWHLFLFCSSWLSLSNALLFCSAASEGSLCFVRLLFVLLVYSWCTNINCLRAESFQISNDVTEAQYIGERQGVRVLSSFDICLFLKWAASLIHHLIHPPTAFKWKQIQLKCITDVFYYLFPGSSSSWTCVLVEGVINKRRKICCFKWGIQIKGC